MRRAGKSYKLRERMQGFIFCLFLPCCAVFRIVFLSPLFSLLLSSHFPIVHNI
jgi:predicted membrane chloride channel (bestrophin family)